MFQWKSTTAADQAANRSTRQAILGATVPRTRNRLRLQSRVSYSIIVYRGRRSAMLRHLRLFSIELSAGRLR